ncbi:LuxR C-terminal-related transcriptional regulator [Actinomadura fibrosa]|uniref:LuxR C-terminal-related transcriptional regulator n=1 Tax=Actinomadura fibrosa TaxID=111802 RepID=A0ABW2XR95_9ACTN|nr:response regulator transcription factor [Actinomadura fibrosa]
MRVIVVEDGLLDREGLLRVLSRLSHRVVATATRPEGVPALVARHRPDLVLLDVRLPPTGTDEGLRLAVRLRRDFPAVAVLVLSRYVDDYAAELLRENPSRVGYLLKDRLADAAALDEALHRIAAGGIAVDPDVVALPLAAHGGLRALTRRERDVLALMAQGLSDRGIAGRLHIAEATVSSHARGVFQKLGIGEDATGNRRVSAVLAYLADRRPPPGR